MAMATGLETPISATSAFLFHTTPFCSHGELPSTTTSAKIPSISSSSRNSRPRKAATITPFQSFSPQTKLGATGVAAARVEEEHVEVEVTEGFTVTQICDKIIHLFLNEKPKSKEWRKYLVFREEWKKYRDSFYSRCQSRADTENDSQLKQKLISLARKVKRIDDEMERHYQLLEEVRDNPSDINAIVARRRKHFTEEFFRLGARCLSAVSAFDNTLEIVGTLDTAQAKFDDILNSPSVDVACEKIKSLAKAKELDSSLILLINSAWAAAKESTTMKNEVKDIMYRLYKATKSSLRSMAPKEIKLLKYLLNITDPEERFSALATAFSPGNEHEPKDRNAIYTTPKELHKWINIMLDAYHLSQEETDIREARQMCQPVVIQRLFILKETIEEEYLDHHQAAKTENGTKP
ncbi:uncharacterized protein At4g37920 isoform X2 [Diospyros lotus]|uniref:uncharacterized protein At4g37920 isoform X2 n=1 Tax=Diospyros lotus TaxID=55363 RepID=UPI002255B3F4|nr:uncharacterized protein At4g37920 isoform X2 [Diospyros lotus]